ncbi:MAG: hypothetical protein WA373_12310 [Burkholderiales bacterium]
MTLSQTTPILTELKLTPQIKQIVNNALMKGRPMSFAYTDDNGEPHLSFRGSLQAYSDTQLAIWVRNPEGGLLKAIARHPPVVALYGDLSPDSKAFITFRGRGRLDSAEPVRRTVYENSPEPERNMDKDRKGVALVIDLDSVSGIVPGALLNMRRA